MENINNNNNKTIKEILKESLNFINLKDIDLSNKKKLIFDTNFLFITFIYKIDIIRELDRIIDGNYQLYIIEHTIDELQKIKDSKRKNKKYLNLIMKFLKLYNFKVIKTELSFNKYYTDDILNFLSKKKFIICTMDKELRMRIKKNLGRSIIFRQKKYLEIY